MALAGTSLVVAHAPRRRGRTKDVSRVSEVLPLFFHDKPLFGWSGEEGEEGEQLVAKKRETPTPKLF